MFAALPDGPFKQGAAGAGAAFVGGDTYALDLAAPQSAPRQARNKGQLQATDDGTVAFRHCQVLIRIALDRVKGPYIARRGRYRYILALAAQYIVSQQRDDGVQVGSPGMAKL